MDITIEPGPLRGSLKIIPSKSQAHRYLICAAFADRETELLCPQTNRDMDATAACLNALGAEIRRTDSGYLVTPIRKVPEKATLPCGESGSTLRFLLPVAGALGVETDFLLEGRLPHRPLSPLWEELERMGCSLSFRDKNTLHLSGRLRPGAYSIRGDVSSQFITGLRFALALIPGKSTLTLHGEVQSRPYLTMTEEAMALFRAEKGIPFHSPGKLEVEGDWSSGAFFLGANALGSQVEVLGLDPNSPQGDRAALTLIPALEQNICISGKDIPDLIPILAVVAACHQGAVFTDIGRLRLKESDRVESTLALLRALGGSAQADDTTLTVFPARFTGGTVDAAGDHRIAMSAAIAATACTAPVTILGAQCVSKSYPGFFDEYSHLGGHYEQHLR